MSSARCLNWSRPPPGRHPALRKQVSCSEPSSSSSSSTSYSPRQVGISSPVPSPLAIQHSVSSIQAARLGRTASLPGPEDFCHQFLVTGAIIHANRFQNYHTYDQARRGGSASLVRPRIVPDAGRGDSGGRHRPASASVGQRTPVGELPAEQRRAVLCKQLSLDQSILVQSSFTSGMATVASGGGAEQGVDAALLVGEGERTGWNGFNRKQQRVGAGIKNDATDLAGSKKALKPGGGVGGKDSRINIKIFLGQTVQQDSSDTGVSDTEGTAPPGSMHASGGTSNGNASPPKPPGGLTPTNVPTETTASYTAGPGAGKLKPTNGNGSGTNCTSTSASTNSQPSVTHSGTNCIPASPGSNSNGNGNAGNAGGRNSSLAQRRAQFQANRQNSEAHDRRHPPLVRALSAPIRPADSDTSKFLLGKKKPRRRKVLREKDEYNICEEDEFSDDGDNKTSAGGGGGASTFLGAAATAAAAAAGKPFPTGLPLRSRSVLGGACDIETLVSLLSSGGSDSEKEQEPTQASSPSPTAGTHTFRQQQFPSAHLAAKGRTPMLKKAGKSVSFQETDLKPSVATAGLNRDYRKPSFQSAVASRMRRTQQLVSTLNAFQLRDKDKDKGSDKDGGEERHDRTTSGIGKDATASVESHPISLSTASTSKTESNKATAGVGATATNGDLQTPKEQECYRLFLKMSKKGLAVSYDTILRGMLTPTELRVLQKKKNREQRNNINGTENGENGGAPETPSPENDAVFESGTEMAFEEIRGLKELHFDRNSQTQDGKALLQMQAVPASNQGDDKESETEDEENTS